MQRVLSEAELGKRTRQASWEMIGEKPTLKNLFKEIDKIHKK